MKLRIRPGLRLSLVGLAACSMAGAASAQTSPYYLGVVQSLGHESNLYRIGDNQTLPAGTSKSDNISGTSLIGGIDQNIGRQRVYGSLNVKANRYANNKTLDNESYGLNLAADWSTVDRWSGTVSLAADQSLAQFNNRSGSSGTVETRKNIINTAQADARVRLGLVTQYSLEASLGYRQVDYSAIEYQRSEYQQTSGSLGLRYRPRTALDLGVALRLTQAKYPRFTFDAANQTWLADTLSRQDIDFTANWVPNAISTVNLRLSPSRSAYDRNTGSNFSGLTGSANWLWQPTGKSRLSSTLWRDTGQSAYATNLGIGVPGVVDYSQIATSLRFRGEQDVTGKIAATATLTYAHRSLVDTVRATTLGTSNTRSGSDNTLTLALGGKWSVTRSAQVGCDLRSEQRSVSNSQISVPLRGNGLSCYGQIVLQ
jgi:hypothetical protein